MKRLFPLLPALALVLTLSGCIQMAMETTLNHDGSGTFYMRYGMSPSVAQALAELDSLGSMDQEMPSITDIDRAELEAKCKEHGVTLKQYEEQSTDGTEQAVIELAFPDLASFNKVMSGTMGDDGSGGFQLFKTPEGDYVLMGMQGEEAMGAGDEGEETMEEPEAPAEPVEADEEEEPLSMEEQQKRMQKSMEIMGKLMSSMSEMNFVMKITVPGDILSSTAMRTEGRTAVWEINGDNMMSSGMDMDEPEVTFSGQGLDLKAPDLP